MNISKKTNSVSGSKYIKIAASMASKLKLKFQTKRSIIDGFIVEAKKAGKLRSSSVIDLPQDLVLFPVNLVRVNNGYDIKPFTLSCPNRDSISPSTPKEQFNLSLKHEGAESKLISFGDVSATTVLRYQGIVVTQKSCMTQTFFLASSDDTNLNRVVIQANVINSGRPTSKLFSYKIDGQLLHQALQKDLMPIRINGPTRRPAVTGDPVAFICARDNCPVTWFSSGKLYTLISVYDNYHYDVKYQNTGGQDYYTTYVSHLALAIVSYDEENKNRELSYTTLNIDAFLPQWLLGDDLFLSRKEDGYLSTTTVKAARTYKIHSVKEMTDGKIVIAASMNKLVPVNIPWTKQVMWNRGENNEVAFQALVSLKIVMDGWQIISVDIFDCDVLCGKNFFDEIPWLPPFSNINRDSFSTDMMLDVLSNGSILCRRQILSRPNSHQGIPFDYMYSLANPHYAVTINGQYKEPISSVESALSYWGAPYILHYLNHPIYMGQHNSATVSDDITAVQWYEPKPEGGISPIGLMFVDTKEDRFKIELAGYPSTTSDVIGLSCPQEEVRDAEGKLITPSVIIAVLRKDSDFVVMVRKGPVFEEGSMEKDYWSEPIPVEEFITIGVLYAKGSSLSNKEHGQYFHNRVEV